MHMGPNQVTVVIPTYNEADNIGPMTTALFDLDIPELQILVVDDASPDGTGDLADDLVRQYPGRFSVCHRTGPRGLGWAYVEGFRRALEQGAATIIQMDCDFSHPPRYIPQFLEAIREYDVVVGSRYVPGAEIDAQWEFQRRLLSFWANSIYTRLILGCRVRDLTAGFKCWRRETLLGIDLTRIRSQGYAFQVEMAYLTERLGYRVVELPIYFEERRLGQSKMRVSVKLEAALRVWELRWRYRGLRPSHRHVPPSAEGEKLDRA
jgi:dolichol-phosphate mannosyltransferase